MKYLSLFSGIGGFELGIQQAYEYLQCGEREQMPDKSGRDGVQRQGDIHNRKRRNSRIQHGVCVGYSEIDKYAIQVYNKHFNHKNYGDITKINAKDLPDFDLLVGGFPCQAFSIAGKRRGFADTRGTLFFEIARIIKQKQPSLLLLENVKGLLSHERGDTFKLIITTLDELGYDCQWQVLNSKNFGVPQNRERVFIIGYLRGTSRPEVFPIQSTTRAITYNNTIRTGGRGSLTKKHAWDLIMRDGRDNRSCLRAGRTPEVGVVGKSIRRLTPKECERLQGFPDDWTRFGWKECTGEKCLCNGLRCETGINIEISDTQRYKMCGNAVTVNVIKEIMLKLLITP